MKTTISVCSSSVLASIGPDMECGFGRPPWTDCVGSHIPGSPPFQVSHNARVRELDTPLFLSTLSEGEQECTLEEPVVQGSFPYSWGSADQRPYEALQVLLGGFLISEEPFGPTLHPGGFVLG